MNLRTTVKSGLYGAAKRNRMVGRDFQSWYNSGRIDAAPISLRYIAAATGKRLNTALSCDQYYGSTGKRRWIGSGRHLAAPWREGL